MPETINSYSYRLRALCRWMGRKRVVKADIVRIQDFTEEDIKNYLYECAKAGISLITHMGPHPSRFLEGIAESLGAKYFT